MGDAFARVWFVSGDYAPQPYSYNPMDTKDAPYEYMDDAMDLDWKLSEQYQIPCDDTGAINYVPEPSSTGNVLEPGTPAPSLLYPNDNVPTGCYSQRFQIHPKAYDERIYPTYRV